MLIVAQIALASGTLSRSASFVFFLIPSVFAFQTGMQPGGMMSIKKDGQMIERIMRLTGSKQVSTEPHLHEAY
jgi:hypothetical protein